MSFQLTIAWNKYDSIEKTQSFMYKYMILRFDHSINLQEEVTRNLEDGWELVGGVSMTSIITNDRHEFDPKGDRLVVWYAQAMKKRQ